MKKINLKNVMSLFMGLGLILFTFSCSSDDGAGTPAPIANFTTEIVGTTVTFTNTSTDGQTYAWDFGDGNSSTEESPTHTYDKFAAYLVALTATNETGSNTKSAALQVAPEIIIDGDMSDWDNIDALSTRTSANAGVVTTVKAASSLTHIYFYMESDDPAFYGFVQLYINSDGDAATGWAPEEHPAGGSGADYELDAGPVAGAAVVELWPWIGEDGSVDWNFEGDVIDDPKIYIAPIKTDNAVEFALVRAEFPNGLADVISFALGDVDRSVDWEEHGYLPNLDENYIELELFK